MNHFGFLKEEFPAVYGDAVKAERLALVDPRTACFYGRRVVEILVKWAFKHDASLSTPYDDGVSALLHDPGFQSLAGDKVFKLAREVIRHGNKAAHEPAPINPHDSVASVSALFQFSYWFARTYCTAKPAPGLTFDPSTLPKLPKPGFAPPPASAAPGTAPSVPAPKPVEPPLTLAQVQELEAKLATSEAALEAQKQETDEELARLRAEVAAAKAAAAATPDEHDYTEAETRDFFIDQLLGEAGWHLTEERDREYPVSGMPDGKSGFVDYVLWGDDGLPLAVVEAKRTRRDAKVGQQQAKLYADCLEQMTGRRPVIYCTNGYQHWFWDDLMYPPRSVQGFHTKDELELLIQRRTTRGHLTDVDIDTEIVERHYQQRAIRRIGTHFEDDNRRKALLVMATGSGKTRTVIALTDVLMRANWAKRILFLADRQSLVKQATREFARFLPDVAAINLLENRHEEGRIYTCTYPTMLNLINEGMGKEHRFGIGHFDLVIIDEAHRSVFKKYKAIFEHFDSLLVGLTATPREEIDRNTYDLFDLQPGVPTDAYPLNEAVADGYLVPPRAVVLDTRFLREGIRYDDLSDEEKETWDELEWDQDGDPPPERVGSEALNRWLFNADTVDKVIENLMTKGIRVAGGDRLGKTIIFAANQRHADFIEQRFNIQYPHLKGAFARTITYKVEHAQTLIDDFSITEKDPHIAISVDMLDTGIDVPQVVNLVFFKAVRSKTKFWQMLGRGTRLSPDLFGPGDDKTEFMVFDHCGNFEYFNQDPVTTEGATTEALSSRLFKQRLDLVATLQGNGVNPHLRSAVADLLWEGVAAINLDNVVVRPHRQATERFQAKDAWTELSLEDLHTLAAEVADLPNALAGEKEEAKRFDLLLVRLQLALLKQDPAFVPLQAQVKQIASALEELSSIPTVKAQLPLIADLQTDPWWEDVTLDQLEEVRRKLRMLVTLLGKTQRTVIYTNFDDDLGEARDVAVTGLAPGVGFEQFRKKARAFLRSHTNQFVIEKIHRNKPITATDLAELEAILIAEGVATDTDLARGTAEAGTLGVFIRSLVGLDRAAAKDLFVEFLDDGTATATQIEFVNLIIDDLTEHGIVDPGRIYKSPYKDIAPTGPEGIFEETEVDRIVTVLAKVRATAETPEVA